jgi:hypothetical protein
MVLDKADNHSNSDDDEVAAKALNQSSVGEVVLLSNDKQNCKLATETEGLRVVMTMNAFVARYVTQYPELNDLMTFDLSAKDISETEDEEATNVPRQKRLYSPHVSDVEVSVGIRSKIYLKGVLRVKRDNINDCYVIVHEDSSNSQNSSSRGTPSKKANNKDSRRSVQIVGMENVNRAVDGDLVAIQILKSRPTSIVLPVTVQETEAGIIADSAEASAEAMDAVDVVSADSSAPQDTSVEYGRVVGIVKRQPKQYAGSLSRYLSDMIAFIFVYSLI